jgi:hypothetical protein
MTANERAAQIWSILALAAHNRQVLTYEMVARLTGVARVGLGRCLEPIQSYCLVKGLSPLTILVVSEKTGMPGVGFVAAQDIPRAQQEVFNYDWLVHGGPSPESFKSAVRERPSNGIVPVPVTDPDLRQVTFGVDELPRIRVGSPRLAEPERAADFTMEVTEELPHAGLRG